MSSDRITVPGIVPRLLEPAGGDERARGERTRIG